MIAAPTPGDWETFLRDAEARPATDPTTVRVRDFIGLWGARGRGARVVERIQTELETWGLATDPDFRAWGLDSTVKLVRAPAPTQRRSPGNGEESGPESLRLQVGNLASASTGVVSVTPSDDLQRATTLMILHDYSQLAVLEGERALKGAVTWESIGRGRLLGQRERVGQLIVVTEPVAYDTDLLHLVPRIVDAGFVFVRGSDQRITGIVTTADLSQEFVDLARPFFLLGEIERRCRRLVDGVFPPGELAGACDPEDSRAVESAADLTLGELESLMQRKENWARLDLSVDRSEFMSAISRTREIRNEVMHFSPDPTEPEEAEHLRGFLRLLRHVAG